MIGDNPIFRVNGRGPDELKAALELVFRQAGVEDWPATAQAWKIDPQHGFVLFSYVTGNHQAAVFPIAMSAANLLPIVQGWLDDPKTWETSQFEQWTAYRDGEIWNEQGWLVYREDWGRVGEQDAICAVKPAWIWLGK